MTKKIIDVRVGTPVAFRDTKTGKVLSVSIKNEVTFDVEYNSVESLILELIGFQEEYGSTYTDLRISKQDDYGYGPQLYLYGSRLETDDECELRVRKEAEEKEYKDKRDLECYERLKAKFEDD